MQDSAASDPPETKKMLIGAFRQFSSKRSRKLLGRLVLEMQAIGEGRPFHLLLHGVEHVTVAMTDVDVPSRRSIRR